MSEYDQSCYNPSLDRVSDGAQHSKAWEEYKTYGTAGRNEDEIEEKNSSDRRFAEEEEEEEEGRTNKNKMIIPKEQLIKQKSYGKIGKTVWDKKAHGGKYYISTGEKKKGYDALEQTPDGTIIKREPGYEKPQSGHTTNFVGNHMTQGAIDLVQHELTRVDPKMKEERMRRLEEAKGIKREPPKLLKVEKNKKKVLMIGDREKGDTDDGEEEEEGRSPENRVINIDRYTWEDRDGEIIVRLQHDEKLMDLKSAQLEIQNERSFTVSIKSKEERDKVYVLSVPCLFDAIVREKSCMLTTAKSLRVTLVKTEVGKAWKRLSSSESSENSMLRLNNAPDGNVKEKGIVIINNNNSNNINLRDLRAEVIKFRDGNLAPKFTPSKTPEEIENELDAQINDVSTPMEFASLKEAMQSCDHFESSGDHANAIKSFSSALFFLRFFTSSSSPPASEDGSEDTTTLEEGGKSTSTTTMEVKIMDCLRRRAKANVLLGKTRNATKDYAEAIQEGKKLLSSLSSSSNATSSAINDKDADATKKILSDLYFERGNAYEQVEKYAEAVDDYKRALKTGGNDTKVSMALTRASKLHFQRDIERKEIEKKRPKNDNENSLPSLPRPGMKQFENRGKAGACF
jgi:tetratricopeptide (TPR) repeat protein|tara:strand:+ start:2457 stop:4334 length:1878 start_codon:yes stop_codon:yes gene_type:complete